MNQAINLLVFDEKNRILLQLRDQKTNIKNPGVWSIPVEDNMLEKPLMNRLPATT